VWGQISTNLAQQIAQPAAEDLNSAFNRKANEWETLASLGSTSTFKPLDVRFRMISNCGWQSQTRFDASATCSFVFHHTYSAAIEKLQ